MNSGIERPSAVTVPDFPLFLNQSLMKLFIMLSYGNVQLASSPLLKLTTQKVIIYDILKIFYKKIDVTINPRTK